VTAVHFHSDSHFCRTCEALLTMAEYDLLCEDPSQAESKLAGAEAILGANKAKASKRRAQKNAGSPALSIKVQVAPPWAEGGDQQSYFSHNPRAKLAFVTLVNLKGVVAHARGQLDLAGHYFDASKTLLSKLATTAPILTSEVVNQLQWQVECYGRDQYETRCRAILDEQRHLLKGQSALARQDPYLLARMPHADVFLMEKEDGLADLEERLEKATLANSALSPMGPISASKKLSPSMLVTPLPATRTIASKGAPRRPTKRLLPPN